MTMEPFRVFPSPDCTICLADAKACPSWTSGTLPRVPCHLAPACRQQETRREPCRPGLNQKLGLPASDSVGTDSKGKQPHDHSSFPNQLLVTTMISSVLPPSSVSGRKPPWRSPGGLPCRCTRSPLGRTFSLEHVSGGCACRRAPSWPDGNEPPALYETSCDLVFELNTPPAGPVVPPWPS